MLHWHFGTPSFVTNYWCKLGKYKAQTGKWECSYQNASLEFCNAIMEIRIFRVWSTRCVMFYCDMSRRSASHVKT